MNGMTSRIHRIKDDEPSQPGRKKPHQGNGHLEMVFRPCGSCIAQRADAEQLIMVRLLEANLDWSLVRLRARTNMEYAKGARE